MRVEIIKKTAECIIFSSPSGCGSAIWCGGDVKIPGEFDVEFDFDNEYIWGEDVFYSSDTSETISLCKGVNKINAKVISVENNVVAISLGGDVILIEVISTYMISCGFYIYFYSPVAKTKVTPFLI